MASTLLGWQSSFLTLPFFSIAPEPRLRISIIVLFYFDHNTQTQREGLQGKGQPAPPLAHPINIKVIALVRSNLSIIILSDIFLLTV